MPHDDTLLSDARLDALALRLADGAARHDRDGSFAHEHIALLHDHGLVGLVAPVALGGGGADLGRARRAVAAVARGDAAAALVLTMTYLQHRALRHPANRWPQALRERVLRDGAAHGALANALRVEPALGSPARGGLPQTIARREGDGWRLSGHKIYTTGAPGLRWLTVWARTDEAEPRVGNFLVPAEAPGLRVVERWDHLGLRSSGSHDVVFDDVALPAEHAVDLRPPAGWKPADDSPEAAAHAEQQAWQSVLLGALYDGVARAARDWLVRFLQERTPANLGTPLAQLPRVQEQLGGIEALLQASRALLDDATARADAGTPLPPAASGLVKHTATANAIAVAEQALRLSGNHGLSRHNPLERHYRDALCGRVHTPQDDAALVAAGRAALGL